MIRPASVWSITRSKQALSTRWHQSTRHEFRNLPKSIRRRFVVRMSRRHRRVIQPTAAGLPSIRPDIRASTARVGAWFRRAPVQPRMRSMAVIVPLEIEELHLQIRGRPEQRAVETFASNGANQPFHEGMRERHERHGLDVLHVQNSQIRPPLVEPIQGIMVRAQVLRRGLASSRSIELNIRHSPTPSTMPRCTPKPTMRRAH